MKKLVLKIGSSTLTAGTDRISYAKIEDLARQIIALREEYAVILVSSGAIAAAKQFTNIGAGSNRPDSKQALAAIGQPKLMAIYDEVFGSFGLQVAQCLLVYRDFQSEIARTNIQNTIDKLLEHGITPIINENDTVAIDEIILGDNDKLSALVAGICQADLCVLASDIDGLYTKNPYLADDAELIEEVKDLREVERFIQERDSALGTGGMTTKIKAAQICAEHQVEMWILNGGKPEFLSLALSGKSRFSKFLC